jgi:hypothetical protein
MAMGFSTTLRTARAQAIVTTLGNACLFKCYDGTRPATGGTATTLLATLTGGAPAGTATNGVLTFNTIASDTAADATGTCTWVRITDSSGTFVADMSAGIAGSGAEVIFNNADFVIGYPVGISSATITEGNA